jgi:hypothetical protein
MNAKKPRPNWGLLYFYLGLLFILLLVEVKVPLSETGHRFAQIGLVLMIFAIVWSWLNYNEAALIYEEREKLHQELRWRLEPPRTQEPVRKQALDKRPAIWQALTAWVVAFISAIIRLFQQ